MIEANFEALGQSSNRNWRNATDMKQMFTLQLVFYCCILKTDFRPRLHAYNDPLKQSPATSQADVLITVKKFIPLKKYCFKNARR